MLKLGTAHILFEIEPRRHPMAVVKYDLRLAFLWREARDGSATGIIRSMRREAPLYDKGVKCLPGSGLTCGQIADK